MKREIKATGTYELTHEELEYGVQLCWRNEPRCSARIQWKNLVSQENIVACCFLIFSNTTMQLQNTKNEHQISRNYWIKEMLRLLMACIKL